jgi:hypothetical protein
MQLKWKKTFLPEEDFTRSPLYETSFHFYNDNNLSIDVDIHVTIAVDKNYECYRLFLWDNTAGIRNIDKSLEIPDIPLKKYDLNSILIFAHWFIDQYMMYRYDVWRKS